MPPRDIIPTVYDNLLDAATQNRQQALTTIAQIREDRLRNLAHQQHLENEAEAEALLAEFNQIPEPPPLIRQTATAGPQILLEPDFTDPAEVALRSNEVLDMDWLE